MLIAFEWNGGGCRLTKRVPSDWHTCTGQLQAINCKKTQTISHYSAKFCNTMTAEVCWALPSGASSDPQKQNANLAHPTGVSRRDVHLAIPRKVQRCCRFCGAHAQRSWFAFDRGVPRKRPTLPMTTCMRTPIYADGCHSLHKSPLPPPQAPRRCLMKQSSCCMHSTNRLQKAHAPSQNHGVGTL